MKFPYSICDFQKIITNHFFYVDRTNRIPLIEEAGEHLLFLRPRRFGKSLLLSMLENYYDVAKASEFERLFGGLAIGQNPTPKHNQYFILNWDFSDIDPSSEPREIRQRIHDHINGSFEQFITNYDGFLDYDIQLDPTNAQRSLQSVFAAVKRTPYKIYLLIDEYDNFANEVMMAGQTSSRARYNDLIQGEGALKAIFKAVKSGTKGLGIDRIFITGVSPVVMSDITSGFNIAENIYFEPEFNDLCGFWENEIAEALQQIAISCNLSTEKVSEALEMMRVFYDGYNFSNEAEGLIYNPTLALYFLKHFQKHCQYPRRILDTNLAMDKGKITYISLMPNGGQIIIDALDNNHQIAISELYDRFGVAEVLQTTKDSQFMASLLYYFGVLTFDGYTEKGKLILKIPNLVVQKLYVERIQEMLLPKLKAKDEVLRVVEEFYQTGNMQSLCQFIEQSNFKVFDNRDYRWTNEFTIKTAFLTLLFDDTFYIMDSETPLGRGYADLTMIIRPDMRQYQLLDFLIEFKYVSLKKAELSAEQVKQLSISELNALEPVKEKLAESKTQLNNYRQILLSRYGNKLRLRTYSVVAVGYERLVVCEL
jgi:hypothetical protein